jgi:hypothetical protein
VYGTLFAPVAERCMCYPQKWCRDESNVPAGCKCAIVC